MKSALIGYTGFVGGNLSNKMNYTHNYNSKNIQEIQNQEFDYLVCAGIPAEMFTANANPEQDKKNIQDILDILSTVRAKKSVLISTIAIYAQPITADERSSNFDISTPYGIHRRMAEEQFQQIFEQALIIRLPALFGDKLKKNFLFDIINPSPAFLKIEKFEELSTYSPLIKSYYEFNKTKNMYQFQKDRAISENTLEQINHTFEQLQFTSLQFTNADSKFQFYNLQNLHRDITRAFTNGISELNICSEPITPKEIIKILFQKEFNCTTVYKFDYNMKSIHAHLWGNNFYLYTQSQIFADLTEFFQKNGVL
ncbi:MAG: NAD-dependent epimerase/dehydratase family protein [Brevinema sp.]